MGDDLMSIEEPSMDPNANQTLPDKVIPDNSPDVVASQQSSDKTIVTQDTEDAPAVVTKENKPNPTPVATPEKKESKPTVNPNALYTGKKNNASGAGDGTGTTAGNQGTLEGDPLSPDYGEGGSGFGNTSLSLENRRFINPPRIEDNGQLAGRVAVEITVNRQGTIISARAGVRGSTLNDPVLWEKCEKAAMGAQLNQLEKAPQTQRGVIMFVFKVR
jgi:outer membrane biosynthesis protein TonB